MSSNELVVVLVTAPNETEATSLASSLVEERLAACVSILPGIRSIYRWEGSIQNEAEVLLLIKTASDTFEQLEARIQELHSYSTPEIVALQATAVAQSYLEWAIEQTK